MEGKLAAPEFGAGIGVEGADLLVAGAARDHQPAGCDQATAEVCLAGLRHPVGCELGVLSERYFPGDFARIKVEAIEGAPRGLRAGVAFGVDEPVPPSKRPLGRGLWIDGRDWPVAA